jgi:hypothetical protein
MADEARAMRRHQLYCSFSDATFGCLLFFAISLVILLGLVRFGFSRFFNHKVYEESLVPALICLGLAALFIWYASCFYSDASRTFRDMTSPPITTRSNKPILAREEKFQTPAYWPTNVVQLAQAIHDGQDCAFALHDALLDAGQDELAKHFCESEHSDRRWALDLILGRRVRRANASPTVMSQRFRYAGGAGDARPTLEDNRASVS